MIRSGRCDVLVSDPPRADVAANASADAPTLPTSFTAPPSSPGGGGTELESFTVEGSHQGSDGERQQALRLRAANMFKNAGAGSGDAALSPLRVGMRLVVSLKPGAMVGEIALLKGAKRMATVRACEPTEVCANDHVTPCFAHHIGHVHPCAHRLLIYPQAHTTATCLEHSPSPCISPSPCHLPPCHLSLVTCPLVTFPPA